MFRKIQLFARSSPSRVVLEVCYFVKVKLISALLDDAVVNNLRRVGDQKKYNFTINHIGPSRKV
ncbi:hypothetical protein H5410_047212 [Solanum commersonii]|uniref:Uncharacterized protein n=1 Tax=Solanum commersonii TaxID=4109 RepID=A0A9J5XGI2_SOLCO|nr:hypothetical protein H5410_047212 [Solanum commersonii]